MLFMEQFSKCLRAQFLLQKTDKRFKNGCVGTSKGGYYTAYNCELKHKQNKNKKTDTIAMIVFIYLAPQYGFSTAEIKKELQIADALFEYLSIQIREITSSSYEDYFIKRITMVKAGLVKNCLRINYRVKPILPFPSVF